MALTYSQALSERWHRLNATTKTRIERNEQQIDPSETVADGDPDDAGKAKRVGRRGANRRRFGTIVAAAEAIDDAVTVAVKTTHAGTRHNICATQRFYTETEEAYLRVCYVSYHANV